MCFCLRFLILLLVLGFSQTSFADAPATAFYVIDTAKLMALSPTDARLDSLTELQLEKASLAHGWYGDSLVVQFEAGGFRLHASFDGSVGAKSKGPAAIHYHVDAGSEPAHWNVLTLEGEATALGNQYVTRGWRHQPVTVILRFLDLKQ